MKVTSEFDSILLCCYKLYMKSSNDARYPAITLASDEFLLLCSAASPCCLGV